MKILMILMMTLTLTSAYSAECVLGATCSETDCKKLNEKFVLSEGKCVNPTAKETASDCKDIVSSNMQVMIKDQAAKKDADPSATKVMGK